MPFLSVCLLLQTDEPDVINFLLMTEIIPLCLGIMESGSELSKTVSTMTQTCHSLTEVLSYPIKLICTVQDLTLPLE